MQTVIIDTDIAIDYLRGNQNTKDFLLPLWKNDLIYLSILSVYELYAGAKEHQQTQTENFISACSIENLSREIVKTGGNLYQKFKKQNKILTTVDCLISATAIVKKHKIATRNLFHYPDKKILFEF